LIFELPRESAHENYWGLERNNNKSLQISISFPTKETERLPHHQ